MALKINTTQGQIGIRTNQHQLRLEIREPQITVRELLPRVQLRRRDAQVRCDASKCREEAGLLSPHKFSGKLTGEAWQTSTAYIGQTARTGDMMARIDKYNISAVMRYLGSQAFEEPRFNLDRIPKSPVKVEVIPGELGIAWKMGDVQLQVRKGDIKVNPISGDIEIFMRQQPKVSVRYVGSNVDVYR